MDSKIFSQEFSGYWREQNKSGLPAISGVYCVYEGRYNAQNNTVDLLQLIYIGESANVRERVVNHERTNDWKRYVGYGNELIFSSTPVASTDRQRLEAALIYEHKPPTNTEYVDSFPFDTTTVYTRGCNAKLKPLFTVYCNVNSAFALFSHR